MPGVEHQNSGPAANAMGVIGTFSLGAPISARGLFFFAILALTCISLSPFPDLGDARLLELGDGNETVTYFLFFVFAVIATIIAWRSDWPALKSLFIPSYLGMFGWVGVTCVISQDPLTSSKRAVMLVFVVLCGATLFLLPRDRDELTRLLSWFALLIIGLSYFGVFFMPEYSIHQATDLGEPQLAGDWRGLFGHKNMASAVFSFLAFIGLFVRKERAAEGWIIFVLSVVFIIASGGKSSTAIFLATIVISYVAARISNFALWALLVGAPLVGLNLLGIGSVLWPSLTSITSTLPLDSSFTGRADVWAYALPRTTETPIFGHGFLAFWNTAAMLYGAEQNTEWASTASHAHNAYLDAVLSMGFPGLLLFLAAFVVQPALDIRRALACGEEPELTLMFQQAWMFTLYLSAFESFFFNRAHPNWVTFLFAVFSLHYLARFKITRSADARSPPRSWMA